MKEAGKIDWAKQEDQLRKLRKKFEGDPAKQAEEVEQFIANHSRPHRGTYFKDLSTGRTAVQTWNYRRVATRSEQLSPSLVISLHLSFFKSPSSPTSLPFFQLPFHIAFPIFMRLFFSFLVSIAGRYALYR